MLGVGVDWAESFHDVAFGIPGKGVVKEFRIPHGPEGISRLIERCLELEPDPAEVRVVLETRHGLLVETLMEAGFTVIPVNPDLVARRRGPARKKDDAEDARICCLLALDTYIELRALIPHGQIGAELRAIARDDVRAGRDERRLGNRLRADLLAVFPAAIEIADGDLSAAVFLKLVERWPSADALAAVSRDELEAFARSCRHGWPDRFADRVVQTLSQKQLTAQPGLVQAKTGSIRLAAAQLLLLRTQRRLWERRMGELLLGGHRPARATSVKLSSPRFDGEVGYLLPVGAGVRLSGWVWACQAASYSSGLR